MSLFLLLIPLIFLSSCSGLKDYKSELKEELKEELKKELTIELIKKLNSNELLITTESTKKSIALAKYLKEKGVVKYSAYWCPNCLSQSELFGNEAYKELNVVECARDGKNSQTKLCIDKKIEAFPTWEVDGKMIIGVQTLKQLAELTGYKQ